MKKSILIVVLLTSLFAVHLVNAQNSVTITSNPTPAIICEGSNITLTAVKSGGSVLSNGYVWSTGPIGNPVTIAIGNQVTINSLPAGSHTYRVTTTFLTGTPTTVVDSIIVTVNVSPVPTISTNGPTSFCQGESVLLTSSIATSSCEWYFNGTLIPGSTGMTNYSASQTGSYRVYVMMGGCSGMSAPTMVTVNPLPNASFTPNIFLDECGNAVTPFVADLNNPQQYTYQWYQRVTGIGTYMPLNGETSPQLDLDGAMFIGDYEYFLKMTNTTTGCQSTW